MEGYANGCPQDNSSTQQIDFGLRAIKIDDSFKSRAGAKMSLECMTHGYASGYHLDKWLARNGQTLV